MIRAGVFAGTAAAFMAMTFALNGVAPSGDPFAIKADGKLIQLDGYPQSRIAAMKIGHARARDRFDVGLFGNSRSLSVGRPEIGLPGCTFFNFSLLGSSYRNSLVLLETLANKGKAPRLALVTIDNFDLQLFTNPMEVPALVRWRAAFRDFATAFASNGVGIGERLRMAWRPFWSEGLLFMRFFQFDSLRALWTKWRNAGSPENLLAPGETGYRDDGSRVRPISATSKKITIDRKRPPITILNGYFVNDLARFGDIAAAGTKVILFETPLLPALFDFFADHPSPAITRARREFAAQCAKRKLTCVTAPRRLPVPERPWYDADHVNPASLGTYLRTTVAKIMPECGNRR